VVFIHTVVIFAKLRHLAMAVFLCAMARIHQLAQNFFSTRHGGFLMRHGDHSSAAQKFIKSRQGDFPTRHGENASDAEFFFPLHCTV
jgi:hypothetical protein